MVRRGQFYPQTAEPPTHPPTSSSCLLRRCFSFALFASTTFSFIAKRGGITIKQEYSQVRERSACRPLLLLPSTVVCAGGLVQKETGDFGSEGTFFVGLFPAQLSTTVVVKRGLYLVPLCSDI